MQARPASAGGSTDRGAAAVARHLQRHASPSAGGTLPAYCTVPRASSPPRLAPPHARASSAPRPSRPPASPGEPAHERLFKLGMARAAARSCAFPPGYLSQQRQQGALLRMDDEAWARSSARLYEEAARRAERQQARVEARERELSPARAAGPPAARASAPGGAPPRRGSSPGRAAHGASAGGAYAGLWSHGTFLDRQEAFLAQRANKIRRAQEEKQEAEEEQINSTCTCEQRRRERAAADATPRVGMAPGCCTGWPHGVPRVFAAPPAGLYAPPDPHTLPTPHAVKPSINRASRAMARDLEQLQAWELRRQIKTTMEAAKQKVGRPPC